jgi:dienelactone hydrolase
MKITTKHWTVAGVIAVCATASFAQAPGGPPADPHFDPAAMRAAMEAYDKLPDTGGTGKYPAIKEVMPSLPNHVVYRPRDLSLLGADKLGVVAWGNGGCSADGAGARLHLAEIASHGYLVIASGAILSGPGSPPHAAPPIPAPGAKMTIPPPATHADSLREGIDWALAENERQGSPFYHRINPKWIAVSGWSCGGLQALKIAADPRVRTVVIHSSGIFASGISPNSEMDIGKSALDKLHTPIIYVLGGSTDIAYPNGMDDFKRIDKVPAFVANLDVGHGGTFMQPNGGREASVAVSWLDWQLKGDKQASLRFTGPDCGLCKDSDWKVESKRL